MPALTPVSKDITFTTPLAVKGVHALSIEYIHIDACLGLIQDILLEAVLSYPEITPKLKLALLRAPTKAMWIQNDFFAR